MLKQTLSADTYHCISRGYDSIASRSYSLHTDSYLDPAFLGIEQQQVFHKSWQFLCHEEKLREAGSYVATHVQGQSVFACQGQDDELRAFYNVCKHRGHELVQGSGQTKAIACPYHAWVYDLDGHLSSVRRSDLIENFNVRDVCLDSIRVEVFCHLVFINLDPNAIPLAEQSESLASEVMNYAPDLASLTYAHTLTYQIKANWKAVVDNFLECYHCPVAHRDFCTLVEMDTYRVNTHGIYSSHMAKAGRSDNKAYGVDEASVTDHAVWYLWPNTTLMRYPGRGNFMVWRFYPAGPEETYEIFDFFLETDTPNETEIEAIKFVDEVLQPEDIAIVESVQRGMQTPSFNQGRYLVDPDGGGMSEHAVHHFHGLVLDAYRRAVQR